MKIEFKLIENKFKTYSAIDQAMPQPSYVDVPRPNSSIITKDLSVADYKKIIKSVNVIIFLMQFPNLLV